MLGDCADPGHQRQRAVVREDRVLAGRERSDFQGHQDRRHPGRGRRRRRQWRGHVFGDKRLGQRRVQHRPAHGGFLLDRKTGLRGGEYVALYVRSRHGRRSGHIFGGCGGGSGGYFLFRSNFKVRAII